MGLSQEAMIALRNANDLVGRGHAVMLAEHRPAGMKEPTGFEIYVDGWLDALGERQQLLTAEEAEAYLIAVALGVQAGLDAAKAKERRGADPLASAHALEWANSAARLAVESARATMETGDEVGDQAIRLIDALDATPNGEAKLADAVALYLSPGWRDDDEDPAVKDRVLLVHQWIDWLEPFLPSDEFVETFRRRG